MNFVADTHMEHEASDWRSFWAKRTFHLRTWNIISKCF